MPPGEQSTHNHYRWQVHAELLGQETSNAPRTTNNKLQHTTRGKALRDTVLHWGPVVDIHIDVRKVPLLWPSNLVRRDFLVFRQSC